MGPSFLPLFETDFHFFRFFGGFFRGDDPLPHGLVRSVGRVLEFAAFVTEVPDIAVAAINVFLALFDGDFVFFSVGDRVFTRIDSPLPPRRDDLDMGSDSFVGQFEAYLVIALARAAVGEAVGAELESELGLALGNHGARHRSAE
jgi:hypothetical protein